MATILEGNDVSARSSTPGRRWLGVGALLLGAGLLGGCLEKPGIEDRWTRIDLVSASTTPNQSFAPGDQPAISARATIVYRSIVTGFAVTELRASSTVGPTDVQVLPGADRARMASDVDYLLAHSVTAGRATRAITGWDHLMQTIDFSFTGSVPATVDSAGITGGAIRGLFLVTYLGAGQKIEFNDGSDTLIVTPFPSSQYQILPIGMALAVGSPVP
jgi:hypothetical protein